MLAITLIFAFLSFDGMISATDGLTLLVLLIVYLTYSINIANKARRQKLSSMADSDLEPTEHLGKAIVFLGLGFVGLALGAKLVVDGALGLANIWGIGETVVGTTIVALGTTLPEIAATLAAAFRREAGVAIGNVIGSNIFNLLAILGLTSTIVPLPVTTHFLEFDIWVLLASAAVILPLAFLRLPIGKAIGGFLTGAYLLYLFMSFTNTPLA